MIAAAAVRQQWSTPDELFLQLHSEFAFTVDAAAASSNAKLSIFWGEAEDALTQPWQGHRVWCNPPYINVTPWVHKAQSEAHNHGVTTALLLPARTEQAWFKSLLADSVELAFFAGRIQFLPPEGIAASSNREGSLLAVFGPSKWGRRLTIRSAKNGKVLAAWERAV